MALRSIIDLNVNDDLKTVIRKVNTNFKSVIGQQSKYDQISSSESSSEIDDAIRSISRLVEEEAEARRNADDDLGDAIDTVDANFANYTKTSELQGAVLGWTQVLSRNTSAESTFVSAQVDLSNYVEVIVSDGSDQKFMAKIAMPSDWVTYTIGTASQFRAKMDGRIMMLLLGTGANWSIYAR